MATTEQKTTFDASSAHIEMGTVSEKLDPEGLAEDSVNQERWNAVEKRLVRKLDLTLMPMVWLLYLFNYLDRNNIAQARLDSFEADLGLVGNQFNIAVSILNVGYMLMQVPSNMILTRVRPSIYISTWVLVWSVVSASTAAAQNYSQLIAIRFFLGIVEAPFFPGAMFLLSSWYPRRQLALRTAVLYSGLILATAFSGLIAAGIFEGLDGVHGLPGWRWLFIIEGAASFFVGLLGLVFLPDFPMGKTGLARWFLTEDEQKVAVERMARDRVSQPEAENSIWVGLKLAVTDIRTWVFVVMLLANHSAYGFINFFPTIVKGYNLGNNTLTLVLTSPPYLAAAVAAFLTAYSSDRWRERGFHISIPQAVACIGFIISAATLDNAARYGAAFLYIGGCFSSNAMVFSWASATLNQTPEKRAAATAIINVISQLGNIYSPYFFPSTDGPRYLKAMLLMMSFSLLSIVTCAIMKVLLKKTNKKLLEEGGSNVNLFGL
ncbi:hypothetical protein J7T55_004333 [Diaporthe amygdali]|uniref:uncharacterized protein n=1 Tax=Phomopsis amygdali TaxID=1214568 RepID=UPI0022FE2181|nr:uncharacterized protein J7T55_004333 [Diaporthe amygdali]KAJ0109783.1 hypothetical protein J7T55_004333 [Diaporthe amygdali]